MPNLDYKHLIAIIIGLILGIIGTEYGIDFSKSCPPTPPLALPAAK